MNDKKKELLEKKIIMPRNEIEENVYSIWQGVLGRSDFGVTDDFFEIGGDSIKAIRVLAKLGRSFEINVNEFFEETTIEKITEKIKINSRFIRNRLEKIYGNSKNIEIKNLEESNNYKDICSHYENISYSTRIFIDTKILILGTTGFLGAYLLKDILLKTEATIYTIVRGKDSFDAKNRLCNILNFYFGDDFYSSHKDRIVVLCGDLTKKNFGLDLKLYNILDEEIDIILNSAAMVKHMGKLSDFYNTNVQIVENIISFAKTNKSKEIHHVSTIGLVYGKREDDGKELFTEDDCNIGQKLNNKYLKSKLIAEERLHEARKIGIKANIYRLGGIMFDNTNGIFQKNIEENVGYIFMRAFYKLGVIPKGMEQSFEISNVNEISEAIIKLLSCNQLNNETFHVLNSNVTTASSIFDFIKEDNMKEMSVDDFEKYIEVSLADKDKEKYIIDLLYNCEIIQEFNNSRLCICANKTERILEKCGFSWTSVNREQINKALDYAENTGFLN